MKRDPRTVDAGNGIALAPRTPYDAAQMYDVIARHRDDLRTWLSWVDATHSAADVRRYAQFVAEQFEQRIGFDYAVVLDGALVGGIGLHHVDWTQSSAAMGYWLSPEVRGRGIMTKATRALTTHAFAALGLHRLEIRAVTENRASRAVAERAGFQLEGVLRGALALHGRYRDCALYGMTAPEWRLEGSGR